MTASRGMWLAAALLVMALPAAVAAQEAHPALAPLARLVGGRWYLGTDSYHTFAWGVGRQSVTTVPWYRKDTPRGITVPELGPDIFLPDRADEIRQITMRANPVPVAEES